ncbi:CTD small phosphatase-like protein 2 [Melia azedarach]|uniref:CTD small phosphatase-like protein 2 n=1 Tax=Melia azedarach TaxID=155640 RepID=A0ACC1YAJ6_MELAZ|nr:CTD small phosphatase-like protein 2 [Melia azedarach]
MPALKMKSKSSTACIKEVSCLHITQKSRKISKVSSPLVRVCCETAEADTSDQHCNNGSSKLELCTMKKGSDEANHHKMWHDGEDPAFEKYFSSAEDPVINKMDPPPPACTTNFEAMCPPLIDGSGIHFGSNTQNNEGCEDGPGVPDMKADDYDNWISYFGQNLMFDMIDGSMKLPALEETTELVNVHFAGSCEELSKSSDNSNSRLVSHQIKPCDQEADVNLGNIESDEVDFDPQSFIRNFLDLSDMGPDLLPAPVPKETSNRNRITLVLDLDETLVHSTMGPCDDADFTFQVFFNMKEHTVYVRQRPFLRTFLERVAEMFEIIVFTASESVYAEQLLDKLDPDRKLIARRAYRESCIFSDGSYTKDLTVLGVDLAKVAIIDNTPQVFRLQVNNGIPIKSWFDDPSDHALISLIPFLETLADADDVRPIIAKTFGIKE